MKKLTITNADKKGMTAPSIRLHPLISWLHFLNLITIAIFCLAFMKIYKMFMYFYKWLFPRKDLPERPVILVVSPKNSIIEEVVLQLSQAFDAEVRLYQDFNFNTPELPEKEKHKKSQLIYSQITISSQETILKLKKYIQKTYGSVDILVISQNENPERGNSPHHFLNNLNKELLAQFWTVMAFLPDMLRKNRGYILSVALGRSSLINTGIVRSIYEELLQCDTKVKLTLVESNAALDKFCLPSLSSGVLASLIVRSMWDSSSVVKVPSLAYYLIILPVILMKYLLKLGMKIKNIVFENKLLGRNALKSENTL